MRILYLAEIVGKAGVFAVKTLLPELKKEIRPDVVVANADGATGGFGLGKNHAFYLHKLGIQILTTGECVYYKKDLHETLGGVNFLLRAANFPPQNPGRGWRVMDLAGVKVAVVSLLGQTGFSRIHLANPFTTLDHVLERLKGEVPVVLVDFHCATTAEKNNFFFHAAGRVSAVIGSHHKVPTADERVLPEGTAVITDAGRSGSFLSVGGFSPEREIQKYLTGVPERSEESWAGLEVQGVVIEIDSDGRAQSIRRVKRICQEVPSDTSRHHNQN